MISTRQKIVVIADQLIRAKGYNAFSYAGIASTLNIKNAAIHYHFPTKAALGKAVIIASREKFRQNTLAWTSFNAYDQIVAFIDMYSKNSKNNCICFMGALGSSFNTLPEEMQTELSAAHKEITIWLINTLEQGKKKNELVFENSPEKMSDLITSGMLASLILDRVSNQNVIQNVRQTLLFGLEKKN